MDILKNHEQNYKVKENVQDKLQKGSLATRFVNYWLTKKNKSIKTDLTFKD